MNIKYIYNSWKYHYKNFGLRASLSLVIYPSLVTRNEAQKMQIIQVKRLQYLKRLLFKVIEEHKNDATPTSTINDAANIYVCWFQGEEAMPPIVKACYKSILQHANGRKVILITMDNYKNYADIPHFIEDKVTCGKISLTHFSDILRNALLYQNGGIWIDATIYLTDDLHIEQLPFFSIKRNESWYYINVSQFRWTAYFIAGVKGNPLNRFVYDGLISYHKQKDIILDYFLVDYIICLGYENIPAIKKMIDCVPYTNGAVSQLYAYLTQKHNSHDIMELLHNTYIHKLSYKRLNDTYPKGSVYDYIITNKL